MIPTGLQIATEARETYLGEIEIAGGQLFTDAALAGPIGAAVRVLYTQCLLQDDRKIRRTSYYNLPAWTTRLTPADMGIFNFGDPKELWTRSISNTWTATVEAINPATATTPSSVDLTISGHGLSTGAQVVAFNFPGMTMDMCDIWHIQAVDSDTIRLLGCSAGESQITDTVLAVGVGTTGVISTSSEDWPTRHVPQVFDVEPRANTQSSSIYQWSWKDEAFRFSPCSSARQLKISHTISGDYGTNLTLPVGIDNSMEFLASYAAALAANAHTGGQATAQALFTLAVGNGAGEVGDGEGGFLGALLRPKTKAQQHVPVRIQPIRRARNTAWPWQF